MASHGIGAFCIGSRGLDHLMVSSGLVGQDFFLVAEFGKLLLWFLIIHVSISIAREVLKTSQ